MTITASKPNDSAKELLRIRLMAVMVVVLAALAHLGWEYTHGGIKSHHLLNRAALPAISNVWELLWLPVLSWFALGRLHRRFAATPANAASKVTFQAVAGIIGAMLYATALSAAFTQNLDDMTFALFIGLFVLAFILPLYRPEFMLGFVLGMTFTFGAILPTLVASVITLLSLAIHSLRRQATRLIQKAMAA